MYSFLRTPCSRRFLKSPNTRTISMIRVLTLERSSLVVSLRRTPSATGWAGLRSSSCAARMSSRANVSSFAERASMLAAVRSSSSEESLNILSSPASSEPLSSTESLSSHPSSSSSLKLDDFWYGGVTYLRPHQVLQIHPILNPPPPLHHRRQKAKPWSFQRLARPRYCR